jgi:hypothetical protein
VCVSIDTPFSLFVFILLLLLFHRSELNESFYNLAVVIADVRPGSFSHATNVKKHFEEKYMKQKPWSDYISGSFPLLFVIVPTIRLERFSPSLFFIIFVTLLFSSGGASNNCDISQSNQTAILCSFFCRKEFFFSSSFFYKC